MRITEELDAERKKDLDKRERELDKRQKKMNKPVKEKKENENAAAKKVLSAGEYRRFTESKAMLAKRKYREKLKQLETKAKSARRFAKYESTRTGRAGKFISRALTIAGSKGGITAASYGSQLSPEQRQAYLKPKIRRLTPAQQQYKNQFNFLFRGGDFAAVQLEREVSGIGRASLGSEGDASAFSMESEILQHANAVNASKINRNVAFDVENEVLNFANILSPRRKRK